MNASHRELIQFCSEILESYNPDLESVDHHLAEFRKTSPCLDDTGDTFLEEVFTGCVRFHRILTVVIDGFYNSDGQFALRAEESLYRVILYLVLFRYEELGISHLKKFTESLDVNKIHKFLGCALEEKSIRTWMKDAWNRQYNSEFVEETILSPLLKHLPELQELLADLTKTVENTKKPKKKPMRLTEPKPFNLTQPKPIKIPVPERIPELKCFRPVPSTTYAEPQVDAEFRRARERNRMLSQALYEEANSQRPSCATKTEKSEKAKQRMKEYEENESKKLNFNQRHRNPSPATKQTEAVRVKLNAAAILREGKLYQKREEQEIKKFEKLGAGYGDATEFNEWQAKMREKDLKKERVEVERRHLDGLLTKEEAIAARQKLVQENQEKAAELKAQAEKHMEKFLKDRLAEEEHARKLIEKVASTHENAREAKNRLQQYKAKIVQGVMEETKELMRQALEEAEIQMKQKMELINEIKEMESGRLVRPKMIDLTESSGCGLLCEMPIAELHERLRFLKMEATQQQENRRNEIAMNKQMKEQLLLETIETIARHRTEKTVAAVNKDKSRKKSMERIKPKDETLTKMEQLIEERKAKRLDERNWAKQMQYLNQGSQKQLAPQSLMSVNYSRNNSNTNQGRSPAGTKSASTSDSNSRLALLAL